MSRILATLALSFALFVYSASVSAGEYNSDAIVTLAEKDYSGLLKEITQELEAGEVDIPSKEIKDSDIDTLIEGIKLRYAGDFVLNRERKDIYKIDLTLKDVDLKIKRVISAGEFKFIDRETGKEIVKRADGYCEKIKALPAVEKVKLSGIVFFQIKDGKTILRLQKIILDPTAKKWNVTTGKCEADKILGNFKKQVGESVEEYIRKNIEEEISKTIKKELAKSNISIDDNVLKARLLGESEDIKIYFYPSAYDINTKETLVLRGQLQVQLKNSPIQKTLKLDVDDSELADSTKTQLILPKHFFKNSIRVFHYAGLIKHRITSDNFKEFDELRNNGLARFFAWPDLGNFPSTKKFIFDFQTIKNHPGFYYMWTIPGGLITKMYAKFRVRVLAPFERGYDHYVDFNTYQRGKVCMQFTNTGLEFFFGRMHNEWDYQWAPSYEPSRSTIQLDLISDRLQEKLEQVEFALPIQSIPLGKNNKIRPRKISLYRNKAIVIDFGEKPDYGNAKARCQEYFRPEVDIHFLRAGRNHSYK